MVGDGEIIGAGDISIDEDEDGDGMVEIWLQGEAGHGIREGLDGIEAGGDEIGGNADAGDPNRTRCLRAIDRQGISGAGGAVEASQRPRLRDKLLRIACDIDGDLGGEIDA